MSSRLPFATILLIVVCGAVLRLYLLWMTNFAIDSDEAIVGLMGMHILQGQPAPVFYYGQDYMGSFEALTAALFFWLSDVGSVALKLVPTFFSLLLIVAAYALGERVRDRSAGILAALFTALGPAALILWSTKARGGFIELVLIGSLSFIAACAIVDNPAKRGRLWVILGLLLGLGWWVNNQVVFYGIALFLFFLVFYLTERDVLGLLKHGLLGLISFFVGGFPFWYENLTSEPRFRSLQWLFQGNSGEDFKAHLQGFAEQALPILFGARKFWSEVDLYPQASLLAYLLYGLSLLVLLVGFRSATRAERYKTSLLLLFVCLMPLIFSWSRFGWLSQAPRYLLPLYSALPVLLGVALSQLLVRGGVFKRFLGAVLVVAIVGLNLSGLLLERIKPAEPHVFEGERVQHNQRPLYRWLQQAGYDHVSTDYWIGYRMAFETQEQITFSQYRADRLVRIPEYELRDIPIEAGVYVFVPKEASRMLSALQCFGYQARASSVGGYVVIDHIRSRYHDLTPVPASEFELAASTRGEWLPGLVDHDPGTRWGSGEPQNPEMFITASFSKPTKLVGIDLQYGFWPHDYPRRLTIEATTPAGEDCLLFDSSNCDYLIRLMGRKWPLRFPEIEVSQLIFRQRAHDEVFDWSLAEMTFLQAEGQTEQEN